jgi:raffinose/stachyose/melibiose transport system substrate-binding protein
MAVQRRMAGLIGVLIIIGGCGGGGPSPSPSSAASSQPTGSAGTPAPTTAGPVTFEIYDLHINEPGKSMLAEIISEFEADHPNVTIEPTILENEALKAKIATEMQAGNPPDLFQSWGGGVLREQLAAGMVRPIDDEIADWRSTLNEGALSLYQVDGKQYGIPYNFGPVPATSGRRCSTGHISPSGSVASKRWTRPSPRATGPARRWCRPARNSSA